MPDGTMDSKAVDRTLREELWPQLKAVGFSRRTGRTAWRDQGPAVQCVSVGSFNAHHADVMGATTYSIAVSLGVFFVEIASRSLMGRFVRDPQRPKEHQCQMRRVLTKGFTQPIDHRRPIFGLDPRAPTLGQWQDRSDVWLILPDGSNVTTCVRDAVEQVMAQGIPWLDRLSDPTEAIRCLMEEPNVYGDRGVLLEAYGGAIGSPSRLQQAGALAAATGDVELLRQLVDQMSEQPYWAEHPQELDTLRAELVAAS